MTAVSLMWRMMDKGENDAFLDYEIKNEYKVTVKVYDKTMDENLKTGIGQRIQT